MSKFAYPASIHSSSTRTFIHPANRDFLFSEVQKNTVDLSIQETSAKQRPKSHKAMETYRKKPLITEDVAKRNIHHVSEINSLEHAVNVLYRYFVLGIDAKIQRDENGKFVTFLIFATSADIFLIDIIAVQHSVDFDWSVWTPLSRLLKDTNITKVCSEMNQKRQLIRNVLGGTFLSGVVDIKEAFRALELTEPEICAPTSEPCDGLRVLSKICYNLLDLQAPQAIYDSYDGPPQSNEEAYLMVSNAHIVFHAYIELERRVRPRNLSQLIRELLTEPSPGQFLRLRLPWESVILVDTIEGYVDAAEYLRECKVIGFDSEWKPTRTPGEQGRMALLQIASHDRVFIFDIIKLQTVMTFGDWALLKWIFENPNIIKLGFDTRDDSKLLTEFMGEMEMETVKDMALIMRALEKIWPQFMIAKADTKVFPVVRGLSRLCNILLGQPLDKSKSLSMTNWERRPLGYKYLQYAALDAHCLVLCWNELLERVGENGEQRIQNAVIAYNVETEALKNAL